MLEAESQTDEAESGCGLETNTNRSTSAWRIQPLAHLLLPLPAVCLPNPSSKYYENTFRDKGLLATNSQLRRVSLLRLDKASQNAMA